MIATDVRVIDTDTHVVEPLDLWTSRLPKKWLADAPHTEWDEEWGEHRWVVAGKKLSPIGYYAMAGWSAPTPSHPLTLDEADHGTWDPAARLKRMDEYGIYAAVLYPNVIAFNNGLFMNMDPELGLACVRAYNDFQTEFASEDPKRLVPLTVMPFWDMDATIKEIERCREAGHRGVVFAGKFEQAGLPHFTDEHWDPFYSTVQDLGMSVNFHAGFSARPDIEEDAALLQQRKAMSSKTGKSLKGSRERARSTGMGLWPANAETIAHVITSGLCDRFPEIQFVSVESGFGYLPYLVESLDWHWKNYGVPTDYPDSLLPSEYFKRQMHACFWFERTTLPLLELFPDNIMFETDYPHPTSLSPGPFSAAENPKDHIESAFANVPEDITRKVLHDNAARLYHLD